MEKKALANIKRYTVANYKTTNEVAPSSKT